MIVSNNFTTNLTGKKKPKKVVKKVKCKAKRGK